MSDDLKTAAAYNTPLEADAARNALEAAGIRAFVADEQTVGWLWHLGTALQGVKVLVAESDLARASEILGQAETPPTEPAQPWLCPKCGARVDGGMDVCWSCGTTIDGVEDPAFEPADEPAAPRAARTDPPGPVLALLVAFILPAAILNVTVGINVFVRGAMDPGSGSLMLLLMACEFLLTVAFFQWWYYQPTSVPAEIPSTGSESEEEPAAAEPAEPEADVIARRACLAAVLGVAFCPPVLNVYSFWLIFRHGLYARPSARLRWLVWLASIVNAAMCVVVALLFLMTGGLRLP